MAVSGSLNKGKNKRKTYSRAGPARPIECSLVVGFSLLAPSLDFFAGGCFSALPGDGQDQEKGRPTVTAGRCLALWKIAGQG